MDYRKHLKSIDERFGPKIGGKEKKAALAKLMKTIKSVDDESQIEMVQNMIRQFMGRYGDDTKTEIDKSLSALPLTGKIYKQIISAFNDKKDRLKHVKKVSRM